MKRTITIIIVSLILSACVVPVSDGGRVESVAQHVAEPTTVDEPAETEEQEEPEAPVAAPINEEEEMEKKEATTRALLAPIIEYPAYIHDQCGAVWGIPANLQGEGHKELIHFALDDGTPVNQSEIDIFTLDGALYITHRYAVSNGEGAPVDAIDYYKQERGEITQVDTMPTKPEPSRASFAGVNWRIETSVINGVEFSYLYNLTPEMIEAQGNAGGKGARMGAWSSITAFCELDNGILIMTNDGALFYPVNRACGNPVSEKGRMWK